MSCLLPQFKCLPDTFAVFSKTHHHSVPNFCSKNRDLVSIRTQCLLTAMLSPASATNSVLDMEKFRLSSIETSSSAISDGTWNIRTSTDMTAVLDIQKLKLTTLDANSNTIAANRPWIYTGAVGPPVEANLKAALATETLVDEEAIIAAAAAEAVALAKAAVEVAKEAALMVGRNLNIPDSKAVHAQPSPDMVMFERKRVQQDQLSEKVQMVGEPEVSAIGHAEMHSLSDQFTESDDLEPTNEDLELLRLQLSSNVAVKSGRQIERKAKRSRAAERAASSIVSVKSGSSSRKKRSSYQEIDYNDPLRYLRGTTSSSRLLTASEEQELSEAIQDLLKLERLHDELERGCGVKPTFAQWAAAAGVDQKTLRRRLNYGIQCKDKMIKSNVRLVISIAKNYQGSGMNIQDLVQEGCRGLVRGAEKFDASKGFKFSTYAHWWIKQAVRKSLSDQSRTIRLPFHMVEATYRVKEARKQLFSEHGRAPNDKEVAEATGLSMKRLSAVLLTPKAPLSLDQKIGFNQNLKPSEVIADPEAGTAEDMLTREFMKQDLKKVLDSLNKREKQVIRWRFGLEDGRMKTLQEIGELMGVSRERIRQIELCAFRKLKSKRRTNHLQQYLHS